MTYILLYCILFLNHKLVLPIETTGFLTVFLLLLVEPRFWDHHLVCSRP